MSEAILYRDIEGDRIQEGYQITLDAALAAKLSKLNIHKAHNLVEFESLFKKINHSAIVIDWNGCKIPQLVIEKYCHSKYCKSPVFVYFTDRPGKFQKNFLKEYGIEEFREIRMPEKQVAYLDLTKMISSYLKPKYPEEQLRLSEIEFHYSLHNDKIKTASETLGFIADRIPASKKLFLQALLLKKQKKIESAIDTLAISDYLDTPSSNLAGHLNFTFKEYAEALKYLQKAEMESPLNLQRMLTIFKCHKKLAKVDPKHNILGLQKLIEINKICPDYSNVTSQIVETVITAEKVDKIPLVEKLLLQLSNAEFARIFKKIPKFTEPFKGAFTNAYINALSHKANELILKDDSVAITYYRYIDQLLPKEEVEKHHALDYCIARAYFRFGQIEMADETNKKLLGQVPDHEKAVNLQTLIVKAKNGEFDVLLDDQKDWLSEQDVVSKIA